MLEIVESSFDEYQKVCDETKKNGVHDYSIEGKCSGCGSCCTNNVPLYKDEIYKIKKYIYKHKIKASVYENLNVLSIPSFDLTCPFLDKHKEGIERCAIYKVRPKICQYFNCHYKNGFSPYDMMKLYQIKERPKIYGMKQLFYGD